MGRGPLRTARVCHRPRAACPAAADPSRDEHFHCYFSFGKKVHLSNRRTSTVFDLPGRGGRRLHPEIQSVGNLPGARQRVIEYDMKDGDWRGELREQLVRDKPLRQPVGSDDDVAAKLVSAALDMRTAVEDELKCSLANTRRRWHPLRGWL